MATVISVIPRLIRLAAAFYSSVIVDWLHACVRVRQCSRVVVLCSCSFPCFLRSMLLLYLFYPCATVFQAEYCCIITFIIIIILLSFCNKAFSSLSIFLQENNLHMDSAHKWERSRRVRTRKIYPQSSGSSTYQDGTDSYLIRGWVDLVVRVLGRKPFSLLWTTVLLYMI